MKAIIEFNLPEDQREYEVVTQATKMQSFLWDFSQQLRNWQKYGHQFKDANDCLDKIREEFYRLINDNKLKNGRIHSKSNNINPRYKHT